MHRALHFEIESRALTVTSRALKSRGNVVGYSAEVRGVRAEEHNPIWSDYTKADTSLSAIQT
jgi:hypothetical protein